MGIRKFWRRTLAGWKPYVTGEKKFKDEVKGQIVKAITPIPDELKKYQKFWEGREFNDDVSRVLATLSKYIAPELVAVILAKAVKLSKVDKKDVEKNVSDTLKTIKNIVNLL